MCIAGCIAGCITECRQSGYPNCLNIIMNIDGKERRKTDEKSYKIFRRMGTMIQFLVSLHWILNTGGNKKSHEIQKNEFNQNKNNESYKYIKNISVNGGHYK